MIIPESELILHPDGSIYHLHLRPEHLAETVITVGDPQRVPEVSKHFDRIEHQISYREFVTHTGYLGNKRLTVISSGIGTDNIDIVLNELDALVNIDFKTRQVKPSLTSLEIIRLGTSGSLSEAIDIDSILLSEIGIGMDGLMPFYDYESSIQETVLLEAFRSYMKPHFSKVEPYLAMADEGLLKRFSKMGAKGATVTATGFYGPQGRRLRLKNEIPDFSELLQKFRHPHFHITNLEMETAAIYCMGKLLGHRCLSVNAILAHRVKNIFSSNPKMIIEKMIVDALEIISAG
ncbi:MAG: nucleoside phosphorylase [Chitinophagales bacterium]